MDQNNFNNQNETVVVTDYTVKTESAQPVRDPMIDSYAETAFNKGLAAAIMSEFPVASIIAIFMGAKGEKAAKDAEELAKSCGVSAGGKCIAGKVLSKVGKIVGIVMTAFWGIYFSFAFFAIAVAIFSSLA